MRKMAAEDLASLGAFVRDHYLADGHRCGARRALYTAQDGLCARCGLIMSQKAKPPRRISVDHVVPKARGGLDLPGNLLLMHRKCNTEKGNRAPADAELALLEKVNATLGWRRVLKWADYAETVAA